MSARINATDQGATGVVGRGKSPRFEPTADDVTHLPARNPGRPKRRNTYQCRACEVEFSSVSVFEDHRWGPQGARGCLTVPFLLSLGYQQDEKGVVSGPPIPEDRKPAFWR